MICDCPRIMIAAPHSGGGKTTLTMGLLQLFANRKLAPAAFKCGPDYIDPLFHRRVVGAKSGNLDLFFTDMSTTKALFAEGSQGAGIAVLEGVMGYYDGMHVSDTEASSYDVARATETPTILVIDVHGASLSIAALIKGFATFRVDSNIRGVILNKCKKSLYEYLAPSLEEQTGIKLLGYVPENEGFAIESRHLGLLMADEIIDLKERLQSLSATLEETIDIEALFAIARSAPSFTYEPNQIVPVTSTKPVLAIAKDRAFSFYYEENLNMLEALGVKLVEFSPLSDSALPSGTCGIYLGGGYPELFGRELSENKAMNQALRTAFSQKIPLIAECGGFMYLQEALFDSEGNRWPMLGVLDGESQNEQALKQFGYITVTAEHDNLYGKKGESIRGHEFHYWHSDANGSDYWAEKPKRKTGWPCMIANDHMVAGFPHLYYPSNPAYARRFVEAMTCYQKGEQ